MSGHHLWSELLAKMPAERRKRIKEDADTLHREYTLSEIRRQAGFTQCQMAEKLNVSQPAYAGFESSDNMRIGTLRRVELMSEPRRSTLLTRIVIVSISILPGMTPAEP